MVVNRVLNNILNNSTSSTNSTEEEIDEMAINEIHELKSIGFDKITINSSGNAIRLNLNNNNSNITFKQQPQAQAQAQAQTQIENLDNDDDDSLEIDSQPSSPQKKFKSSCDDFEIISNNSPMTFTTTTTSTSTSTPLKNSNHMISPILNISSSLIPTTPFSKKINFDHVLASCKNDPPLPIPQPIPSNWVVNGHQLKKFEKSEQEVANIESDDEEFDDYDDDDDFDDEEFSSKFEEMKSQSSIITHSNNNNINNNNNNNGIGPNGVPHVNSKQSIFNYQQQLYGPNGTHNNNNNNNNQHHVPSTNTTPMTSPKSNPGTPSRPFPTLDYKIKSESVKQNADGTYSCPYPTCNKTIKGNKGNLSSHLRWHRRLDAEAGELRDSNPIDEGEEEFTTPIKPSQRGVQLRNQMIRYGLPLFRQDSQGKYLCFFDNCNLRMLTNFSRHIAKHERKNDRIKPDLVNLIPTSPYNGPTTPIRRTHSSPNSPTSSSSNFSPLLVNHNHNHNNNNNNNNHNHHHHHHNGNGNNNNNGGSASSTPICQSPLTSSSQPFGSPTQQSANDNQSKLKRKLHVKVNSSPNRNSENNNINSPSINNTSNRDMTNLITPHSEPCTPTSHKVTAFTCSPSFSSHHLNSTRESGIISIIDSKSKGKVDSLIAGDNLCSILTSPSSSSLLLSPSSNDFSAVPTSPTSPLRSSRIYNNSNSNNNSNNNNSNNSPLSPLSQSTPSLVTSPIILSTLSMNSPITTSQNSQQQQSQILHQSLSTTNLVAPPSPTSTPSSSSTTTTSTTATAANNTNTNTNNNTNNTNTNTATTTTAAAAGAPAGSVVVVNNSSNTTTINKSLFRNSEIQWEFRSPAKKLPLSPTSSPQSPFQSSVVPLLTSSSSSINLFKESGKSKNKEDEMVVKSLLDLSQSDF